MSTRLEVAIESNPHALSPNLDQVGPGISPASEDRHTESFGAAAHDPDHRAQREVAGARSAPLDLIEEHLTDATSRTGWRPAQQGGFLVRDWFFPDDWNLEPFREEVKHPVLKVQPFAEGGYEATVRMLNLERIGSAIEFGGCRGKREAPAEPNAEHLAKAGARAKQRVRYLVRNMCASHLCTLTRRETMESGFWSPDDWAAAWDRLRRSLVRAIGDFPYVAILEQHAKGNYHLHVAWVGRINLNLMRPLWWSICGGRGQGNVDAQYIKVRSGGDRSYRIARYISKYVAKHFEDNPRFNKKRYWASKQTLDQARRYVLRSRTMDGAMDEVRAFLGLDWGKFIEHQSRRGKLVSVTPHLFLFPGGDGLWISFIPELHSTAPPF